jgi:cyanate lyase
MTKSEAVSAVLAARRRKGIRWEDLAQEIGRSTVWTTAALLGRHSLTEEHARMLGAKLELDEEAVFALSGPAERGSATIDRSEPVLSRLEEVVAVYGGAIRELILEEFGDGIMSAIDFELSIARRPDEKGDRVVLTLDGKFLPYRTW